MAEILKRGKALSVSPLKASSTIGAALAFLGFRGVIPMLHGSQGEIRPYRSRLSQKPAQEWEKEGTRAA
jgi:nitrogenase molybdenum-iron protein alpha/beta subunit